MSKHFLNKKDTIKKKIELRHQKLNFIEKHVPIDKNNKSMNERDRLRTTMRNTSKMYVHPPPYQKKVYVDYDVVVCIPSHERYNKVRRILTQLFEQPTRYTIKVIVLNDGSIDIKYNDLCIEFPQIIYLKNEKPNGKTFHWYCYNQMWEHLKNIQYHALLQTDDDFILSDNFLNTITDLFFENKINDSAIMAISPHLWSFKKVVESEVFWKQKDFMDGIALIDYDVISKMNYMMKPVDALAVSKPGMTVGTWSQINETIKIMGGWIYRTENSLVYHDGNDDSQLHGDVRKNGIGGVYTQKYIGKL